MALGKNVQRLRELLEMTRPQFAEALGLDHNGPQKIYALETRDSKRSDLATRIAHYFGITTEALIDHDLGNVDMSGWAALKAQVQVTRIEPGRAKLSEIEALFEDLRDAADNGILTSELIGVFSGILRIAPGGKTVATGKEKVGKMTGGASIGHESDLADEDGVNPQTGKTNVNQQRRK
ncbi:transcriptional regulator with XRE-family HTH domain [Paraburkholderia sp. GAS33]|uniref:helix-turn-helix transcriptional regulator n=1 Tax=Paraburkholderia sp. GAS33 TaxID=3035130 RepID=UPI003D1A1315